MHVFLSNPPMVLLPVKNETLKTQGKRHPNNLTRSHASNITPYAI